jgi:competence protein ComEA
MATTIRSLAWLGLLAASGALAGPVNINTADAATLSRELKGIGAAKAQAIVEFRQKNGAFRSVEELSMVKGIGQRLIDQNRTDLRIDKPGAAPAGARPGGPAKPAPAAATRK